MPPVLRPLRGEFYMYVKIAEPCLYCAIPPAPDTVETPRECGTINHPPVERRCYCGGNFPLFVGYLTCPLSSNAVQALAQQEKINSKEKWTVCTPSIFVIAGNFPLSYRKLIVSRLRGLRKSMKKRRHETAPFPLHGENHRLSLYRMPPPPATYGGERRRTSLEEMFVLLSRSHYTAPPASLQRGKPLVHNSYIL